MSDAALKVASPELQKAQFQRREELVEGFSLVAKLAIVLATPLGGLALIGWIAYWYFAGGDFYRGAGSDLGAQFLIVALSMIVIWLITLKLTMFLIHLAPSFLYWLVEKIHPIGYVTQGEKLRRQINAYLNGMDDSTAKHRYEGIQAFVADREGGAGVYARVYRVFPDARRQELEFYVGGVDLFRISLLHEVVYQGADFELAANIYHWLKPTREQMALKDFDFDHLSRRADSSGAIAACPHCGH